MEHTQQAGQSTMGSCDDQQKDLCAVLGSMGDDSYAQQEACQESRPHLSAAAAASAASRASSSCLCHCARAFASSLCFSLHTAFHSHIHSLVHPSVHSRLRAFMHEPFNIHSWWRGAGQHCSFLHPSIYSAHVFSKGTCSPEKLTAQGPYGAVGILPTLCVHMM